MEQQLTALIVPVPEAEPLVGSLRGEPAPAAALGVAAHVTVMFPVVPRPAFDARGLPVRAPRPLRAAGHRHRAPRLRTTVTEFALPEDHRRGR